MHKQIFEYLQTMVTDHASDLYLTVGAPPTIKIEGRYKSISEHVLQSGDIKSFAYSFLSEEKQATFEKTNEMNLALSISDIGRFRVNVFVQRNEVGMVIRSIRTVIPQPEELRLPAILKKIVMNKAGLIFFVGATGTGKSTSLASLIEYRNQTTAGHIITVEDPIEFSHTHAKSIINQREIGIDTSSYKSALENALRQAPDVILVGEVRERDTMEYVMTFAETGHLCLTTLHAHNSNQAIERIINFFPQDRHPEILLDLSLHLTAIISQRLVMTNSGKRIAAFEILLNSPLIADLIKRGEVDSIKEIMQRSETVGMQTFDTDLFNLYQEGLIDKEEAIRHADSASNLQLKINLSQGIKNDFSDLSIEEKHQQNLLNQK